MIPEGAVVVPGARAVTVGAGPGGPFARHPGDRQVPRREDGRPHGARSVAALSPLDLARALIDIDSTTGREAEACAWLAALPARARLPRHRAAGRRRPDEHPRPRRPEAHRRPLDPRRLRAALLPEPGRGRPPLRPRRLRREGRPRRAGHGGGAAARERRGTGGPAVRGRRGARQRRGRGRQRDLARPGLPRQRGADREPAGPRDARGLPGQAPGDRARRPLVPARSAGSPRSTS